MLFADVVDFNVFFTIVSISPRTLVYHFIGYFVHLKSDCLGTAALCEWCFFIGHFDVKP